MAIDPHAVLAGAGVGGRLSATPIAGGWDTTMWRVEGAGRRYALRLFRETQVVTCDREVAAMGAAAGAVPVPRVALRGAWQGRPVLLIDWAPGETLVAAARARPWRVLPFGLAFGAVQARLHRDAPVPESWREEPDGWIAWAGPEEGALQRRLRALPGRPAALLHLDYHPLNVMVDGHGVTAVLDWANARAGDPRADVARTLTILRLAPVPPGRSAPLLRALLVAFEAAWRRGYRRAAGAGAAIDDPAAPLFNAWAGTVMVRDLTPKLGRPGIWLRAADLDGMRAWVRRWKDRAGLSPD
jgi:aminoglycoside phosphotransferase (APT) family kinase protein